LGSGRAVGPGKIRLLEQIHRSGSIIQAGRDLGISYRRAWLLIDDLNNCFRHPVIEAEIGGIAGGGTTLTQFGRKLVGWYRAIEADAWPVRRKICVISKAHWQARKGRAFVIPSSGVAAAGGR
jgi:molybdate transport system regulatory protein